MKNNLTYRATALFLFIAPLLFFSCENDVTYKKGETIYVYKNHVNDDKKNVTFKNVDVKDYDNGVVKSEGKVDAYFFDGKDFLPYVEFEEFFGKYFNNLSKASVDLNENTATYTALDFNGYEQTFVFNWLDNTLSTSSGTLFNAEESVEYFLKEVKQIQMLPRYYNKGEAITFDFGAYGFDILFYKGKCLVPFCVLETLLATNLPYIVFNGTEFSKTENDSVTQAVGDDENLLNQFSGGNLGKNAPEYFRQATLNVLEMEFDYAYGKKYHYEKKYGKGIVSHAVNLYSKGILSTDSNEYSQTLFNFINSFDDFNTYFDDVYSIFWDASFSDFDINVSELDYRNDFKKAVSDLKTEKYGSADYESYDVLKISDSGDTIVLNIDDIAIGEESDWNDIENGWKKSAYGAMRKLFEKIKELDDSGTPVSNIVLDFSTSTSGEIGAMVTILGFMTEIPMFAIYDTLEDSFITYRCRVDTNADGNFGANDVLDKNWYILTSPVTCGIAHCIALISSHNGIAKIIGEKTAGGSCLPIKLALPDGSVIEHSSRFAIAGVKYTEETLVDGTKRMKLECSDFIETEDGITPDIDIDTMDAAFYGDIANEIEKALLP